MGKGLSSNKNRPYDFDAGQGASFISSHGKNLFSGATVFNFFTVRALVLFALLAGAPGLAGGDSLCYKFSSWLHTFANPNVIPFQRLQVLLRNPGVTRTRALIPLGEMEYIHPLNYPIAARVEKHRARVERLRGRGAAIEEAGVLTMPLQEELIPSPTPIRAIQDERGRFIVLGGNGRLGALQEAFPNSSNLLIEVELVSVEARWLRRDLLSLVRQIRLANGLE